jgi:hypothetical protein
MVEVQHHGFVFENWIEDTFTSGYCDNFMQKWDIPAEENRSESMPEEYRNIPVLINTAKFPNQRRPSLCAATAVVPLALLHSVFLREDNTALLV